MADRLRRFGRSLVGLPLFWKVLLANAVVVLLGVTIGTWFTMTYVAGPDNAVYWSAIALLGVFGFAGTLAINALVLVLALQPLHALERTVDRVSGGDPTARVQPVLFTDPDIERLGNTLNGMLDVLEEHRAQLKKLSHQVLSAQEDERKRIARELHDETAQSLTTLLVNLKVLERARDPLELRSQIQQLREITADTLEAVRQLAVELRPTTLDNLGLLAAIEACAEGYSSRLPTEVRVLAQGFDRHDRLEPQVELVVYRVVQEALTNVVKHAEAKRVHVHLTRTLGQLVAEVRDDGRGFDVEETMHTGEGGRGLGLFGMQERLALVGGRLRLESTPGAGTLVEATVPLRPTTLLRRGP